MFPPDTTLDHAAFLLAQAGLLVDEVGDACNAEEVMKLLRLRGGGHRQREASALHDQQEITGTPARAICQAASEPANPAPMTCTGEKSFIIST